MMMRLSGREITKLESWVGKSNMKKIEQSEVNKDLLQMDSEGFAIQPEEDKRRN